LLARNAFRGRLSLCNADHRYQERHFLDPVVKSNGATETIFRISAHRVAVRARKSFMAKTVIITVDDDAELLHAVERDLRRRYGERYGIFLSDPSLFAVASARHHIADRAADCDFCAIRPSPRRRLASDLRDQGYDCALSQFLHLDRAPLRESASSEGDGSDAI
jgi:hypothetical protein